MEIKCFGCGVAKNPAQLEVYTHPETETICDDPICPLFVIHCEGKPEYKAVVVCFECFHLLDVDMWISPRCWEGLRPCIPYERLPPCGESHNPADYSPLPT